MIRHITGIMLVLSLCLFSASPSSPASEKTPGSHFHQHSGASVSLQRGDVFRGHVELMQNHFNPAELTVYISKATPPGTDGNHGGEFTVEAIAIMNTQTDRLTYGLSGIYVPSWKQLNLYEIRKTAVESCTPSPSSTNTICEFEPVGLAGQFSKNGVTLHCKLAFNGNGALTRIMNTSKRQRIHDDLLRNDSAGRSLALTEILSNHQKQ